MGKVIQWAHRGTKRLGKPWLKGAGDLSCGKGGEPKARGGNTD